jgi:CrcB protein
VLRLFIVLIGGSLGSGARFLLADFVERKTPAFVVLSVPTGTMAVNMLGCLVFGVVLGLWRGGLIGPNWRLFLLTGICGGFTTFSAFSSDTLELIVVGREGFALLNVVTQVLVGVLVLWGGMVVAERLS